MMCEMSYSPYDLPGGQQRDCQGPRAAQASPAWSQAQVPAWMLIPLARGGAWAGGRGESLRFLVCELRTLQANPQPGTRTGSDSLYLSPRTAEACIWLLASLLPQPEPSSHSQHTVGAQMCVAMK